MSIDNFLTGLSYHNLDEKNRLFIPPKYRANEKKFVITCGLDNCIIVYPLCRWSKAVEKIEQVSIKNKLYQRAFSRLFFAEAHIVELDTQGRILIPKELKIKFNLKSEVVLVGNKDKLEIWSKQEWQKYYNNVAKMIKNIRSQIDI
ncbi:MAG: division/cell wall cluster transcriptional repressor MraZ [Endomicrobia bacterium]|nr:division/cell wall cluster transcriptional repressor MraZ [Endomicrobiia bacterium]